MSRFQRIIDILKRPVGIIFIVVLLVGSLLAFLSFRLVTSRSPAVVPTVSVTRTPTATPTPTPTPPPAATPTPTPIILPPQSTADILGVDGGPSPKAVDRYPGIPWVRTGHPTCGWGNLKGQVLKDAIQYYHSKGVRVLFVVCQASGRDPASIDFDDIARAYPDAVQCGNEQMKQDASVSFLYVPPEQFAQFYDRCERAVHAVRPETPVLLGSLDPHVAGPDYQLMLGQVNYLDQMQNAMNSTVRPGRNWNWRDQALGLIDSWYNGYRGANNLAGIFDFWAQQFRVDRNGGELGKHLWVVEGTACFRGCGVNENDPWEVAVVHILGLITDVQTSMQAKVPFFHFSGQDFQADVFMPMGILSVDGHPKPLRQDLPMGAVKLTLSCPGGKQVEVADQLKLLANLYAHCSLPSNYVEVLTG